MFVTFIACCFGIEVTTRWRAFPFPDDKVYDEHFRVPASSDTNSPDYVEIKSDGGSYDSNSNIKYALDGKKGTFWESGKIMNGNYKIVKVELTFKKHMMQNITRIIMLGRQSSSKGIPMEFEIYIADNATADKTLIYSANYNKYSYRDYMQIDINKSTFGYMQILISRIEGGQGRPNIAEIAFYKEDKVATLSENLFTDGTWSKLNITIDEAKEFVNLVDTHPAKKSLAMKVKVLKEVVMHGDKLEKTIFEIDHYTNFIDGSQHGSGAYGGSPVGYYLHNQEAIDVFCEINTVNKPWLQTLKFLDKNWDYMSNNFGLNTGYNRFVAPVIDVNNLTLTSSMITLLFAGYKKKPGDVGKPRCRVSGGTRFPLYIHGKTNPCEFEKSLISYQKHIDCNRLNFQKKNTVAKYDVGIVSSVHHSLVLTASGLYQTMLRNRNINRTFADTMTVWETLQDQYQDYDGFDDNDPKPYHHTSKSMHLSILIAQNGKPYAWADGFFTGYNNYKGKEGKCMSKGGFLDSMAHYKSFAKDGWAYYHEWGHIYDNNRVKVGETTNNLYCLMMERYLDRRPNRIERDGYISGLYDYTKQPKNLNVWQQLIMLRQFEMFYGQDKFHKEFMRWLREGNFAQHAGRKEFVDQEVPRWPFAATLFTGYDVLSLFLPHKYNWTEAFEYMDPFLKNITLKKVPNTLIHANDRFQYNLEVKDQKGCNLNEKNKIYLKQMVVIDGKTKVQLGITGIDNEFIEILGYEMKDMSGQIERFCPSKQVTVNFGDKIDHIVTPVTLKLRRLPPAHIEANTEFEFADQSKWTIDTVPKGVGDWEGGKLPFAIDGKENTCYFSPKVDYDHGVLIDLGEETEFYGFKYHIDGKSWGHGKNVTLEYSMDNVSWIKFPTSLNGTNILKESLNSGKPKYQIYLKSIKARYIKAFQYGMDTQNTRHFRLCDFKLVTNAPMKVTNVENDPDYLASTDICDEKRDQSIFLDKSRYGYIEVSSQACEVPLNITEDEWAADFEPEPDFHWPDDPDQQDGGDKKPKKGKTAIIGIAVASIIVVVVIIIGAVYFVRRNCNHEDSDIEVKEDFTV